MACRSTLECVDKLLNGISENNSLWGGKTVLEIGNFCQVALVVSFGRKTTTFDAPIVSCPLFQSFSLLNFYQLNCHTSGSGYGQWGDNIREGIVRINAVDKSLDTIADVHDINIAIAFLYPPDWLENA